MSKEIVFNYSEINGAITKIKAEAETIKQAGTTMITKVTMAVKDADGASMSKFKNLIQGSVSEYVKNKIPTQIDQIADVLNENAKAMKQSDDEIAKGIPESIE